MFFFRLVIIVNYEAKLYCFRCVETFTALNNVKGFC